MARGNKGMTAMQAGAGEFDALLTAAPVDAETTLRGMARRAFDQGLVSTPVAPRGAYNVDTVFEAALAEVLKTGIRLGRDSTPKRRRSRKLQANGAEKEAETQKAPSNSVLGSATGG